MKNSIFLGLMAFGLTACIHISQDQQAELQKGIHKMSAELQKDKQVVCAELIQNHGWKPTNDGSCTKQR